VLASFLKWQYILFGAKYILFGAKFEHQNFKVISLERQFGLSSILRLMSFPPILFSNCFLLQIDVIRERKKWTHTRAHAQLPSNCNDCTLGVSGLFRLTFGLIPIVL